MGVTLVIKEAEEEEEEEEEEEKNKRMQTECKETKAKRST